jgi:Domain of unknown function (DUF1814).
MSRKPHLDCEAGREAFVRIKDLAAATGEPIYNVATRYVLERLLFRIFESPEEAVRRLFVTGRNDIPFDVSSITVKGGLTMTFAEDVPPLEGRSTGDADLHLAAFGGTMDDYAGILRNGLGGPPLTGPDDGVRFDVEAIRVARDREEGTGGSLVIPGQVGQLPIQVKTDVTFDARPMHDTAPVVPYPSIFPDSDLPPPRIRRVPFEFMVADKFEAAVRYGMANKRVRDYADMRLVLGKGLVDPAFLAETLAATMRFKGSEFPESMWDCPGFSDEFAQAKASRWENEKVTKRFAIQDDFPAIMAWLREELEPVMQAAKEVDPLPGWAFGGR